MISTDLYKSFVAVYRSGSVSAAARQRHLTQSAVSQQLAALEDLIGAPLFRRSVKGMLPTARGKSLYDQVFESLDRLDRVSRTILRLGDPLLSKDAALTVIRLGTSADYFDSFALGRLVQTRMQFAVSFGDPKELLEQLQAGMLDVVLSVAQPAVRALQYRVLAEKRFFLVGPRALEPPATIRTLRALASWLKTQRWVGYSVELPRTRRFWQQVLHTRFESNLALVVADLRTVLHAVELGMGITLLPEYICSTALRTGTIRKLWSEDQFIDEDRWILSFRELDADQPAILKLAEALT